MMFQMIVWDVGCGEAVNVIDCHPDVIYSMSFNRDGSLIATTCKDKKLRIIEPRRGIVLSVSFCLQITNMDGSKTELFLPKCYLNTVVILRTTCLNNEKLCVFSPHSFVYVYHMSLILNNSYFP